MAAQSAETQDVSVSIDKKVALINKWLDDKAVILPREWYLAVVMKPPVIQGPSPKEVCTALDEAAKLRKWATVWQ